MAYNKDQPAPNWRILHSPEKRRKSQKHNEDSYKHLKVKMTQTSDVQLEICDNHLFHELYDTPLASIDQQIRSLQDDHAERLFLKGIGKRHTLEGDQSGYILVFCKQCFRDLVNSDIIDGYSGRVKAT
jgi:hypothetical protein